MYLAPAGRYVYRRAIKLLPSPSGATGVIYLNRLNGWCILHGLSAASQLRSIRECALRRSRLSYSGQAILLLMHGHMERYLCTPLS